jgi:hypothetical protein
MKSLNSKIIHKNIQGVYIYIFLKKKYLSLQTIQWVDPDIDQVGAEMEGFKSGNRKQFIRPEVDMFINPK